MMDSVGCHWLSISQDSRIILHGNCCRLGPAESRVHRLNTAVDALTEKSRCLWKSWEERNGRTDWLAMTELQENQDPRCN